MGNQVSFCALYNTCRLILVNKENFCAPVIEEESLLDLNNALGKG